MPLRRFIGPLLPAREMPAGLYAGVFLSALSKWPDALAELAYGVGFAAIVAAYLFRNDAVEAYFARAELARASLRSAKINRALT